MIYDNLTPEQAQRADALDAAATVFGAPSDPAEDYLLRTAQWIITGQHTGPTESDPEVIYEGGGVNQLAPDSDTADEDEDADDIPVSVGRDFSHAQRRGPALDEVDTTHS